MVLLGIVKLFSMPVLQASAPLAQCDFSSIVFTFVIRATCEMLSQYCFDLCVSYFYEMDQSFPRIKNYVYLVPVKLHTYIYSQIIFLLLVFSFSGPNFKF